MMQDAHMIRRDGKAIPIRAHYYFWRTDEYTNLDTAQWLFDNSLCGYTKDRFVDLIFWYVKYFLKLEKSGFVEKLLEMSRSFEIPLREDTVQQVFAIEEKQDFDRFVDRHWKNTVDCFSLYVSRLDSILNSEFLRERYGGLYETNYGDRNMYFRISSPHDESRDWFSIIYDFVKENVDLVDTVSVVRDFESVGGKNTLYWYNKEFPLDKVSIKNFMKLNPLRDNLYFPDSHRGGLWI